MDYNFDIWYETYDPDYLDINIKSRVPDQWLRLDSVSDKYANSILKPTNQYTEYMCPAPDLVSIDGNQVRLRQKTHAEIMIKNIIGEFSTIEKLWLRQYYQSSVGATDEVNCFKEGFLFFSPWVLDEDISVKIEGILDSPFEINTSHVLFNKIDKDSEFINPPSVNFAFKRYGQHMKEQNSWGIIRKATPIYDMVFSANDIIVERIKDFYEKE